MKRILIRIIILSLISILLLTGCSERKQQQESKPDPKILIVYYSFTGSTKKVSEIIKELTGADTFEIQPEFDYFRNDIEELAKKQIKEGFEPDIQKADLKIESFDYIFIGSPVWWFSPSPPVMSFINQYDLKNKKIIPFCTYKGDYGDFFSKIKAACPDSQVLEGEAFISKDLDYDDELKKDIKKWLTDLEVLE